MKLDIPELFKLGPLEIAPGVIEMVIEVNPECQWVIDGEGVPTRMYDGVCVEFDGRKWKGVPDEYERTLDIAIGLYEPRPLLPGTYEFLAPGSSDNIEDVGFPTLVAHAEAKILKDVPRGFDMIPWLRSYVTFEGIVWHHPDGRMAKVQTAQFE